MVTIVQLSGPHVVTRWSTSDAHWALPNRVRIEEGECVRIARPSLLLVKESPGHLHFFLCLDSFAKVQKVVDE